MPKCRVLQRNSHQLTSDDMDYVSLNQCISEGVVPGQPVLEVSHRDGNNIVDFERAAGCAAIVDNRMVLGFATKMRKLRPPFR